MTMKLIANYDLSGKIHSLTAFSAPKGVSLMLTPSPGHIVAEVEGHGLKDIPDDKTLREIATSNTIAAPTAAVKLSKTRR
jgi:hypothetical protein